MTDIAVIAIICLAVVVLAGLCGITALFVMKEEE